MKLIELLKFEEGLKLEAYQDTVGVWTVGYGDTGPDVVKGLKISKEEADARLEIRARDANTAAFQVVGRDAWEHLNPVRRVVIASMCYQMGPAGLAKFIRTLAAVRAGQWDEASIAMLQSAWAKQTPNRARRAAAMMLTGMPVF